MKKIAFIALTLSILAFSSLAVQKTAYAAGEIHSDAHTLHNAAETYINDYAAEPSDHGHNDHYQGANHDNHDQAHDDHHGETEGLPQLDPTWYASQVFWLVITFMVMFIPFKFKILPDVSSTIERRREQIEGDLSAAKELKQKADDAHDAYQTLMQDARDKASALFIRAEDKIKDLEKQTYGDFYKQAAEKIALTEKEVLDAKDAALISVNDVAADVAAELTAKITGIKVGKDEALSAIEKIQNIETKRAA